jgi:hypothetical protein
MRLGRRERVLEQCVDEPPSADCDHELRHAGDRMPIT